MELGALNPVLPAAVAPARGWWSFFRRFFRVAGAYWNSERKWFVRGLTALLVVLTVCQVAVQIVLNIWTERLYDALARQSMPTFVALVGVLALIVSANVAAVTAHLRIKRHLQIAWREWFTRRISSQWMDAGRHYQVTYMPGEHSNPDGRIAEDVRISVEFAVDLGHSLLYCALLLVSFASILWSLSGAPEIAIGDLNLYVPGHLVWAALSYAVIGGTVALLLGRPLVRAVDRRQTHEANFRFGLVRARENSLPIALLHGEADERRQISMLFKDVVEAWNRQTAALANIFMFTSSWSVLLQVVPVLIAAPRFMAGTITLGVLMQIAQAFQQTVGALSWPVDNLSPVAEWRASVERVLGLDDALRSVGERADVDSAPELAQCAEPILAFRGVSIADPDGKVVLDGLDFSIAAGERVLIVGDAAAAIKLFKAVAGLWRWGSGRIVLPCDGPIYLMPQQPYMPVGSLREALCYPVAKSAVRDGVLLDALGRVGLSHLAARMERIEPWEQVLPSDELQRLAFARLLVHRPKWIFLQEATEALGAEGEAEMLTILAAELPGAAVVSIDNHGVPGEFFRRKLTLTRHDGYAIVEDGLVAAPT